MKFNLEKSIQILEKTPLVLEIQLKNLHLDWINAKEGENTWSPKDIVGHFIVGEETDWIPRAKLILESENEPPLFTSFDMKAHEKEITENSIDGLLDKFKNLRKNNVQLLKEFKLQKEDYLKQGVHPVLGLITLNELLATWVVHDLGHLSQVNRILAKEYKEEIGPWKAYFKIVTQ